MQYLKVYLDDFHWLILILCEEKLKSYKNTNWQKNKWCNYYKRGFEKQLDALYSFNKTTTWIY